MFLFFFPPLDHFCLELPWCHCRGRGLTYVCGWVGSMYCFYHTLFYVLSQRACTQSGWAGSGAGIQWLVILIPVLMMMMMMICSCDYFEPIFSHAFLSDDRLYEDFNPRNANKAFEKPWWCSHVIIFHLMEDYSVLCNIHDSQLKKKKKNEYWSWGVELRWCWCCHDCFIHCKRLYGSML